MRWRNNTQHCIDDGTELAVVNGNGRGISYVAGKTMANGKSNVKSPSSAHHFHHQCRCDSGGNSRRAAAIEEEAVIVMNDIMVWDDNGR